MGCNAAPQSSYEDQCEDDPPNVGEIRAKQVVCDEELPDGAEGEVGDWLLENDRIRLIIRGATHRLTKLDGTGGTILDASIPGEADGITEIYPIFEQAWPSAAVISATESGIRVEASDESGLVWEYHLSSDSSLLTVEGATGFTMVPAHGAYRTGDLVQSPQTIPLTVGGTGGIEDDGGWVHWRGTHQLGIGELDEVIAALHPNVITATGETDGRALQVHTDNFDYAFSIEPGAFSSVVPTNATMRALRAGFQPSNWETPSEDLELMVGPDGFISTSISNDAGEPVAASVYWNDQRYDLPPGPNTIAVGPGEGSGWIDAGPKYGIQPIENQTISGTLSLETTLQSLVTGSALVAIDAPAFPDRTERNFTDDRLTELAAAGVDYAILTAGDEVAQANPSEDLKVDIASHAGSRANSDMGSPLAFPWSYNRREPAHGAAPWKILDPLELLAFMSKAGRRTTVVDRDWVESAGPVVDWDPLPDWFIVRNVGDIDSYITLLDHWVPTAVLGNSTWVSTETRNRTDILRAMIEGKTTATTGPQILFLINGKGPGSNLYTEYNDIEFSPDVQVQIQNPGDIEQVTMIGSGGIELVSWKPESPPSHYPMSDSNWVLLIAKGDTDWAITSPIWLRRP